MGAWAYCPRCDAGLAKPTLREALARERRCPHCEALLNPNRDHEEALLELADRVEWLCDLAKEVGREFPD